MGLPINSYTFIYLYLLVLVSGGRHCCRRISCDKQLIVLNVLVVFLYSEAPDSYRYRTAQVGRTVKFFCRTKLSVDVDWARSDTRQSKKEYLYHGHGGRAGLGFDPRFTVLNGNRSHSLLIYNVTVNDSAYYQCIEDGGQGNRHFFHLTVEGSFFVLFCCSIVLSMHKIFHVLYKYTSAPNRLRCQITVAQF